MPLTVPRIKDAIKSSASGPAIRLGDGGSLCLYAKSGRGYWVGTKREPGKAYPVNHSLGVFGETGDTAQRDGAAVLSLAAARIAWQDRKADIRAGRYFRAHRTAPAAHAAAPSNANGSTLFGPAARAWIEKHKAEWSLKIYKEKLANLDNHLASLHGLRVGAITVEHVADALRPIWTGTGSNTGGRTRTLVEKVLAAHHVAPNPAAWETLREHSNLRKTPAPTESHPSIDWHLAPELFARIGASREERLLKFVLLCATRVDETARATWSEFDLTARTWKIPAAHRKLKNYQKEDPRFFHIVPLSDAAIALLGKPGAPDALVFPAKQGGVQDDKPVREALQKFGYTDPESGKPTVTHGLRSAFGTWAQDNGWDDKVTHFSLAHYQPPKQDGISANVHKAYLRATKIEERTKQIAAWAAFLSGK